MQSVSNNAVAVLGLYVVATRKARFKSKIHAQIHCFRLDYISLSSIYAFRTSFFNES